MNEKEIQNVLDELNEVRPEVLDDKAKRLFEAIMKIADDRDKANKRVDELINEVTLKDSELDKKDKIINEMAERLEHDTEWFFNEFDNYTKQDFIKYFTKKVEES